MKKIISLLLVLVTLFAGVMSGCNNDLSEEDKKDVVTNIDKYSLDEIEAKLSIICVRNKVSFNLDEENHKDDPMVYNLGGSIEEDATTPAWVKAALKTAQTLK